MNRYVAFLRVFSLVLLSACAAFAQRDLGTLVGTVTDPSGGIVVNAQVTVTEEGTGVVYQLTTNSAGEFVRPAMKPSTYTVVVSAPGFRKSEQKGIVLTSGERTAINIALTVGDVGQTVEVAAQGAVLQTESTQAGADLNAKTIADVPLGGQRNVTYLARLSPGVVPAENGARDANNGGFSANGVRSNGQNNFLLNGVDNNINTIDFLNQTAYAVGPSVEAIGEVNIITNGYNAEYGRAAGGVFNVNLKSGTNQLHGSVFELYQNKVLDANTWNNNLAGAPRGPFNQNQFGGTLGGAIKKNTLFIFGDYQGTRIASSGGSVAGLGRSGFLTIPTAAFKKGDFSSLLGPTLTVNDINGNPVQVQKGGIYDPMSTVYATAATATANAPVGTPISRTIFPGNIIPPSRFDQSFAKILSQYPNTNQSIITGNSPARDFYYVSPGGQITDQGDARVDYRLSDKDSLFGSVSWGNTSKTSGAPFPGPLDGADFNGASEIDLNRNGQISYTRVWKPTLVSETRVSFTRLVTSRLGANPTADLFTQFGIAGYNPTTATTANGGLPQIQFNYGGTSNVYQQTGANDWIPTKEYNNVWDFIQNVALSKGSHAFKFGGEFRPIKFPFFQVPDPHGNIAYNGNQTAFPTNNSQTGDAIASALLGQIDSGNISTTNFISSQKSAWGFYAQDDWKLTRKLTLNLGVRYELWSPIDERFARQANFDLDTLTLYIPKGPNQDAPLPPNFATAFPTVKVVRGTVPSTLIPWDKTDIAPRIGIAYQAFKKTVVRLGYGIFYGGEENQGGSPNRGEGVPFNETVNLQRTSGVSSFVSVSDPNCPGCNYFPSGLTGGYPTNVFTLPAPVSFRGVQNDFRTPLVHKWNVIVQRELPHNLSLEVGYLGNHQARQLILWNSDPCPNLGTTNTSTFSCDNTRIVRGPPGTAIIGSGLSMTSTFGFGNYDALTAKLEKRYSNGIYLLSSYTYGHALANSGTPLSGATNFGTPDPTNLGSAYSSAAWDIRQNFTTAFNYDLPFGTGKKFLDKSNKAMNAVIGNWQVNGILTLRTGQPYTISGTSCLGNWGKCMPDFIGSSPDLTPHDGRSPGTNGQWFDVSGYRVAAPLTGGSLGLQSNTGPPTRVLDFSVFKDFRLTERFRVQFRSEFFNIANTPQFSTPDANLSDAKIPAGANGSAAVNGNGNFGKVLGANVGSERHVQFSLRLQF